MKLFKLIFLLLMLGILSFTIGSEYLKKSFTDIKTISTIDFLNQKELAVVIDVRSEREYSQAHIKDAINLPLYMIKRDILERIVSENKGNPLIFYCISEECGMSFQAARLAASFGISNIWVYEAGFIYFISQYPEQCIYDGNPLSFNFYNNYIRQRLSIVGKIIPWDKLEEKAKSGYVLINLSNPEYFVEKMDKYVSNYLRYENVKKELKAGNASVLPEKRFILLDNFGREAVWLEDDLIKLNKSDYYFVDGGLKGYFDKLRKAK